MATYRSHTPNLSIDPQSLEVSSDGYIHISVFVQLRISRNPDVWQDIPNGHRTVVLNAAEVLAITDDPARTNPQKRQALRDLIQTETAKLGLDPADEAATETITLLNLGTTDLDIILRDVS